MTCNDVRARLSEWLDGDTGGLTAAEREAIAGHLQTCAECRAELDGLEDASSVMRALPRIEAPPFVQGRALALGREYTEELRERGARDEDVPRIAALSREMSVAETPPEALPPRPLPPAPMRAPAPTGEMSPGAAGYVRSRRHLRGRNVRLAVAAAVAAAILGLAAYLFFS
jgi:hypothetical protein